MLTIILEQAVLPLTIHFRMVPGIIEFFKGSVTCFINFLHTFALYQVVKESVYRYRIVRMSLTPPTGSSKIRNRMTVEATRQ
jgi:hypothetical protein